VRRLSSAILLLALNLLIEGGPFQTTAVTSQTPSAEDRSQYVDQPVTDPESLSGIWEAPNGAGGVVGIDLQLSTTLSAEDHTPWVPQAWQSLEVVVFERKSRKGDFGESNGFSDSKRDGGLSIENNRLTLHYLWSFKDTLAVDIDLVRKADGCWHGRFHRNSFDRIIALCRPSMGRNLSPSSLRGAWWFDSRSCVHIAQEGPNIFEGWADSLLIPGKLRFAPWIPGPHRLFEHYGTPVKVESFSSGSVHIQFGAYSGFCCPHDFLGRLSKDGSTLQGAIGSYPETFTRVRGDSCSSAIAEPSPAKRDSR
jgi:hypothetical protein